MISVPQRRTIRSRWSTAHGPLSRRRYSLRGTTGRSRCWSECAVSVEPFGTRPLRQRQKALGAGPPSTGASDARYSRTSLTTPSATCSADTLRRPTPVNSSVTFSDSISSVRTFPGPIASRICSDYRHSGGHESNLLTVASSRSAMRGERLDTRARAFRAVIAPRSSRWIRDSREVGCTATRKTPPPAG